MGNIEDVGWKGRGKMFGVWINVGGGVKMWGEGGDKM